MQLLRNPVRGYAWGSRSVIAKLQGRPVPSPGPEAELWIGAHPGDPSTIEATGVPLTSVIAQRPAEVLSEPVVTRFGARLPYLLKLLAAGAPLSLQAHPDPDQAAAGYAAEEAAGVPLGVPHRRYVDPYHKPELLVAVGGAGDAGEPDQARFRALCGFRDPGAAAQLLAGLGVNALAPVEAALRAGELAAAVRWLLAVPEPAGLVAEVVAAAAAQAGAAQAEYGPGEVEPGYRLVEELAAAYPGDVGVVLALLLNEVTLVPDEAIFMPAGNLHSYLHGTGVEIMAASDNVLRGGLTPKHVDAAELLRMLRYEPLPDPVLRPSPVAPGVVTWPVPVAEFALHRVRLTAATRRAELALAGPRTVLCLAGELRVDDGVAAVTLGPGRAGFAAATDRPLGFAGVGEAYVASVGHL